MSHLYENSKWNIECKKDECDQIIHMFFTYESQHEFLCWNPQNFIMNCIYKMNRYKLSLLIISGIISLNISFYAAFCFIVSEKQEDYIFALQHLKSLYIELDFSDLKLILTDDE